MHESSFQAIGTRWSIALPETLPEAKRDTILAAIRARIDRFDADYSRFREDSLLRSMTAPGTYRLPDDAEPLFDLYRDLYARTGGAFTPLIGSTLSAAGYDASYSFSPGEVSAPPAWEDALEYSYPSLTLRGPALLDVGAAGKGYLVDIVSALIRDEGVERFIVDAGGDIRIEGELTRIALEHPDDSALAIGVAELAAGSICGSSGSRRAWETYHHIIDPRTLASPQRVRATWVTASTALLADALATCLFLAEPDALSEYEFEHLVLYTDGSVRVSSEFPGEIFTVPGL